MAESPSLNHTGWLIKIYVLPDLDLVILVFSLMFYEMDISNLCIRTYKEDHLYPSFQEIPLESLRMATGGRSNKKGVEMPSQITITKERNL